MQSFETVLTRSYSPAVQSFPKSSEMFGPPRSRQQPCGVDLTLKRIKTRTSPGSVEFDNILRLNASTVEVPFIGHHEQLQDLPVQFHLALSKDPTILKKHMDERQESVMLKAGAYLIEFNETVDISLSLMGQIFGRSSLFRSGAILSAGVMDCGYQGAVGAMLQVVNPDGLLLFRDGRLAQMVFHEMSEPVEGCSGMYKGSGSV